MTGMRAPTRMRVKMFERRYCNKERSWTGMKRWRTQRMTSPTIQWQCSSSEQCMCSWAIFVEFLAMVMFLNLLHEVHDDIDDCRAAPADSPKATVHRTLDFSGTCQRSRKLFICPCGRAGIKARELRPKRVWLLCWQYRRPFKTGGWSLKSTMTLRQVWTLSSLYVIGMEIASIPSKRTYRHCESDLRNHCLRRIED